MHTQPNLQAFVVNAQWIVDYFAQHVKVISVQPVSSKKSSTLARNKCRYSVRHGCAESDSSHCGNCGRDKWYDCIEEDGEVWRNEDYYFMYRIAQLGCMSAMEASWAKE